MSEITDTNDVPVNYLHFSQAESLDSAVFVLRIPCVAGQWLAADANSDVSIMAREHGTADAYVDLSSSPIDLTPYAGSDQDFDFKVHTNAIAGLVSTAVNLRCTATP